MFKNRFNKALLLLSLMLTGCTSLQVGHLTRYASNVHYYSFLDGSIVAPYAPKVYPMKVPDDLSFVQFVVDLGYDYVALPFIYTDSRITENTAPFFEFLAWSKQPFIQRQETKQKVIGGRYNDILEYGEENDLKTQEPVFLVVRHFGYFFRDAVFALTVPEVENLLSEVYSVKYCKEHGLKL